MHSKSIHVKVQIYYQKNVLNMQTNGYLELYHYNGIIITNA